MSRFSLRKKKCYQVIPDNPHGQALQTDHAAGYSLQQMMVYLFGFTFRIYEVTDEKRFLELSMSIFDWVWREGWDTSVCGGGVWFDQSKGGKETIENVQMVQLGAKLARWGHGGPCAGW